MLPSQTLSRSTRSALRAASWTLRWMLLLVAWQGPLPWFHAHGTLGNCASCPSAELRDHLRTHHSAIDRFANVCFNWHFHVDLPVSPDESNDATDYDAPRVPPVDAVDLLANSLSRDAQLVPVVTLTTEFAQQQSVVARRNETPAAEHFFDCFAPTLSLPQRFCVARC